MDLASHELAADLAAEAVADSPGVTSTDPTDMGLSMGLPQ